LRSRQKVATVQVILLCILSDLFLSFYKEVAELEGPEMGLRVTEVLVLEVALLEE
jgi:hypothetical protein